MDLLNIDWCINCAYSFTKKNIKERMFADIFIRIAKAIENKKDYFYFNGLNEFKIKSDFYYDFIKNQSCLESLWFKKRYWRFFIGMIATAYNKENLFIKKCKISFNKKRQARNKDNSITFYFK